MQNFIKGLEQHIIEVVKEYDSDQVKIEIPDDRRDLIDYLYIKENLLKIEKDIIGEVGQNEVSFIWNPATNIHELYMER